MVLAKLSLYFILNLHITSKFSSRECYWCKLKIRLYTPIIVYRLCSKRNKKYCFKGNLFHFVSGFCVWFSLEFCFLRNKYMAASIHIISDKQKYFNDTYNIKQVQCFSQSSSTLYLHKDILTSAFRWCKIMWYLLWLPGAGVGEILSREENIREKTHIRNFKCCSQFLFIETGVMQYQTVTLIYNV